MNTIQNLYEALRAIELLKLGECWCERAIGNPNYRSHSPQCAEVRLIVNKIQGN